MINFRLKVFYSVASHLNFTKAAEELLISQPAVSKNIKELESELGFRLFDRILNKVTLTGAGLLVLDYVKNISELDQQLLFDLNTLENKYSGHLKIGTSTTIGQYVLPSILAQFHDKYSNIKLSLFNDNSQNIEKILLKKEIELALVEGSPGSNQLKYIPYIKDEIVAIVHTKQPLSQKDEITLDELKSIPLVLRESGSGSLEIIQEKLKQHNIKLQDLNIIMSLGSTESIKSYLSSSNSMGLVSINAVNKEIVNGEFKVIDIKDFEIERMYYFVHPHGKISGLAELFIRFVQKLR